MTTREERRRPYPAPPGFHWEPTSPHIQPAHSTWWLVEDGRSINVAGFFEDYERGISEVPNDPMPRWSATAETERRIRKVTQRVLEQRERELREKAAMQRLREEYRR